MGRINKIEILKYGENEFSKVSSVSSRIKVMFFQKKYSSEAFEIFNDWLSKPLVYILKGYDYENDNFQFYVGETINFFQRSNNFEHYYNEEWVEQIIIISSKDQEQIFNKSELQYFEKIFINKLNDNKNILILKK
ncbi:hypothetical protein [Spiroplasma sp. SV19]|uniref:hypothetical protein n=1 Tax=Spiroplasma sp. SV19 TaxID=2570468 RepID=UPI0024B7B449|nr:hypothetical protein [Spiroplasma sp. SV19]WHQ37528.1 hypothetical protein E7Y35_06765 [Spiroplasma sp. SV19]